MEITMHLKERFCKDMRVPIRIFDNDIFVDRMSLFDSFYDCLSSYDRFVKSLSGYKCEQDYLEDYNKTKDNAINFIKGTAAYETFNSVDMNKYGDFIKETTSNLPTHDIFSIGKYQGYHLSADIRKANFSCLRKFDATMFDGKETWEDFIAKFTDNPHIIASKYIREVVLGNCNPKRHITYEKYHMARFYQAIVEKFFPTLVEGGAFVEFFSNDEIIFNLGTLENITKEELKEIMDFIAAYAEIPLRPELYTLRRVYREDTNETLGFIKYMDDVPYDFKCFDAMTLPLVLRKLKGEEYIESDLMFVDHKMLAKYIIVPTFAMEQKLTSGEDDIIVTKL